MRLLLIFMLLLPKIASANLPVTYIIVGEYVYDSNLNSIIIKQEAVIDFDGFEFMNQDKKE